MTFQPGQSGNPAGRPPGARNRRTIAVEKFLDENAEKLMELGINRADDGDSMVLRLFLQRILPRAKHSPVAFELPPVKSSADALGALDAIVQGVGHGDLAPAEAAELGKLVRATSLVAVETQHEERLNKLEEITAEKEKDK